MFKKAVSAVLLLTFLFALAPAAGTSGPPGFAVPEAGFPTEVQQTGEPLLAAATGGSTMSCVGAVLGFSFTALALGAATGAAGIAIVGAFAPVAMAFCK